MPHQLETPSLDEARPCAYLFAMARRVSKEESKLRLSAEGRWYHDGELATHDGVSRFFHRQIRKDEAGDFFLYNAFPSPGKETLEEHVYFDVEDVAYFVEHVDLAARPPLAVTLNTTAADRIDPATLRSDEEGRVYGRLVSGDEARLTRHAMVQLEPQLVDDDGVPALLLDGGRHRIEKRAE
ncbi:MAG: DUF1285 domain-containing protein [Polyangiaceae bacterium]